MPDAVIKVVSLGSFVLIEIKTKCHNRANESRQAIRKNPMTFEKEDEIRKHEKSRSSYIDILNSFFMMEVKIRRNEEYNSNDN